MKRLFFVFLSFCAFYLPAFSQSNNSGSTNPVSKLKGFYSNQVIEKTYLHFDRPYYWAGDTIFFKAYVTFGEQHELSTQNKTLNVDLISPQNIIIRSIKLQLKGGLGWGDFELPVSLPKGYYRVRAFTKLMKDEGLTDFFEQSVCIGSPAGNKGIESAPVQNTGKPEIQFFPEGGNLVTGLNSKVAFKAINKHGAGLNAEGVIVDNTGKTVTTFTTKHLGMGYFYLLPEDGKTYKAKVTFANGDQNTVDLPAANAKGIVLALDNGDPELLKLSVSCNKAYFDENQNKEFNVVINSGIAVSRGRIKLSSPLFATSLKKGQFRSGVVQFTLFSPDDSPLAERLVFINRPDQLKLSLNTVKNSFSKRQKTVVSVTSRNKADSLVSGHFSVAVINETQVHPNENKENTILTWLLLGSDLRGYIEQPNYYFAHTSPETSADLDVLMLTQGFRRFVWKKLLDDKYPPFRIKPDSGLAISGLISNGAGKPAVGEHVDLISLDGGPVLSQLTDTAGRFSFTGLEFPDSTHVLLKAGNGKNKNTNLITYNAEKPQFVLSGTIWPPDQVNQDSITTLKKVKSEDSLKINGTNAANRNADNESEKNKKGQNLTGSTAADQVLYNKDLGDGELIDKLTAMLRDVLYLNGNFYLQVGLNSSVLKPVNNNMLLIVDGNKVLDLSGLQTTDVEKVEVIKDINASTYGAEGAFGVLIITTKRGKDVINSVSKGPFQFTFHGYYRAKEFYSPKYENSRINNGQKDFRSTIYWQPEIITGKDGNASFEYYNADGTGTYRIVIEGIDDKGNLGRQVYRYKVE